MTFYRKDWMRILALKTFAVTIGLDYNNNHTLTALKQLTTVSKCICVTTTVMYIPTV